MRLLSYLLTGLLCCTVASAQLYIDGEKIAEDGGGGGGGGGPETDPVWVSASNDYVQVGQETTPGLSAVLSEGNDLNSQNLTNLQSGIIAQYADTSDGGYIDFSFGRFNADANFYLDLVNGQIVNNANTYFDIMNGWVGDYSNNSMFDWYNGNIKYNNTAYLDMFNGTVGDPVNDWYDWGNGEINYGGAPILSGMNGEVGDTSGSGDYYSWANGTLALGGTTYFDMMSYWVGNNSGGYYYDWANGAIYYNNTAILDGMSGTVGDPSVWIFDFTGGDLETSTHPVFEMGSGKLTLDDGNTDAYIWFADAPDMGDAAGDWKIDPNSDNDLEVLYYDGSLWMTSAVLKAGEQHIVGIASSLNGTNSVMFTHPDSTNEYHLLLSQ